MPSEVHLSEMITIGNPLTLECPSPKTSFGVVFEDDGETGYFYARDYSRPEHYFVDALHVYDVAAVVDPERPSQVRIIWSRDFMVAALLINQLPHVMFHFGECCGYAKRPFPDVDPKSGWTHQVLHSGLQALFYPKE